MTSCDLLGQSLHFRKVWQVIHHFGVLFFCNLGTSKTVISEFVTTANIVTPYLSPYGYPSDAPGAQENLRTKKALLSIGEFLI